MRPGSIVNFERVVVLIIGLGLLSTALHWDLAVAQVRPMGFGDGFVILVQTISACIYVLLLWLIARRRSVVAMWIYVLLQLLGLVLALANGSALLRQESATLIVLNGLQWLLVIASIWLLFRADARAWFRGSEAPGA